MSQSCKETLLLARRALNTVYGHHCFQPATQELVSAALRAVVKQLQQLQREEETNA